MIKTQVSITSDEAMAAAAVGALRQIRVIQKERQLDHGSRSSRGQRDRWANQIHGAFGEIAFSKAINQAWTPGGGRISNGDVAGEYEVRATEMDNDGTCIFIYEGDLDDKWYVLAVGHFPDFHFPGAIKAKDGKQKRWWNPRANPPCYWVPKDQLTKITDIWGEPPPQSGTDAERAGHPNGFVGHDSEGRFVHYCWCGKDAGLGYDVKLTKGQFGTWFCKDHKPELV